EPPDLPARVVDVELAKDLVARPFEQVRNHVSDDCPASVADMHRTGGVRADELHHRAQAMAGIAAPEALPPLPDGAQRLVPHVLSNADVEEPGSAYLRLRGEQSVPVLY